MSASAFRFPAPLDRYARDNEAAFRRAVASYLASVQGLAGVSGGSSAGTLDSLSDVDAVTGLASGKFLKYNGTLWVPSSIAESDVTNLVTDLAAKAPLASPTFTGDPKAPTPSAGDNDTSVATTAYVQGEIAALGAGLGGYGDEHAGTTDIEIWYIANAWYGAGQSTFANTTGTLRLMPFVAPSRGGTIDRLAFEVTTVGAAGALARIGLYSSKGQNNVYPDALLSDSGDFDVASTGGAAPTMKIHTLSQALTAGQIYWVAMSSSLSVTVRSIQQSTYSPVLGQSGGTGATQRHFLSQSFTHGALPANISAGATKVTGSHPACLYRFSA